MIAAIGLGSNLQSPEKNVEEAISHLSLLGQLLSRSHLYKTKPWGVLDQPDFCNACILLETELSPHQLLAQVKNIEREMGRTPTFTWGPRLIDIDILTIDDLEINEAGLVIPHPHMNERAFVLVPLAEIAPVYAALLSNLPESDLSQISMIE